MVAALGAAATPAFAASPWWHLDSSTRPSYLQPGQARDEVQKVVVTEGATEFFLEEPVAIEHGKVEEGVTFIGLPSSASVGEVKTALETLFGAGSATVTGTPGEYRVTFIGGRADRPVRLTAENTTVTEITKGRPDGEIVLTATNLGDANASPTITIKDMLPPGLEAVAIEGTVDENLFQFGKPEAVPPLECSLGSLSCTFGLTNPNPVFTGIYPKFVPPYEILRVHVALNLAGASSGEANVATVTGGGAPAATVTQPITVSATPPPFGVSTYEIRPEAQGGGLDTQAGSHPFQLTTTFNLNEQFEPKPVALAKDLHFKLPAGLIGNPNAVSRCAMAQFLNWNAITGTACSARTVVGVARSTVNLFNGGHQLTPFAEPLYSLEPAVGEPARFGFIVEGVPILLNTAVRTGGDYGVTVNVTNLTEEIEFLSSEVTFWGVPGDEAHNNARGFACLAAAVSAEDGKEGEPTAPKCPPFSEQSPSPLLSLPTSCTGRPLQTSVQADSWEEPHEVLPFSNTAPMVTLDGCSRLPFEPQIKVSPDGQAASTPTGLTVDVHVAQQGQLNPNGLANSNIKNIAVTLPEGVILNPAAADGLQACSEGLVGFTGAGEFEGVPTLTFTEKLPDPLEQGLNFCPDASKVGTVKITSPLLPPGQYVTGAVYLATPAPNEEEGNNPFRSTVAMYIVARDPISGFLVKLPGRVSLNQQTDQISATVENSPQLAFEDAEIHFFGGERAPLATPAHCGTYTTEATFTPWSASPPVRSTSSFEITSGPNGAPCPSSSLPFAPSLDALMTDSKAGEFSPLSTTISRADGNQDIQTVQLHMPPGLSGILAGIPLCPEAQANAGTCSPESEIGETIVSVGLGGDPFTVTGGKVYLTEKYQGAPFGLSIVNPADAGPFHLGKVIVRARIEIDPTTAALTITTGEIPHILKGIPLQIKHVNVTINRPGFTFNPTNCSSMAVTGTIGSVQGASSPVSDHFEVTNCAALKFAPKFQVSIAGHTTKQNGSTLTAKLSEPKGPFGSQANITKVKVDLPRQLPSRLTTLQKACLAKVFEASPASCPAASIIGHAKVITPLLPVPLEGPAYFISHGGEDFPSLTMVLKGYGVTVQLVGSTLIKKGITSTTFRTVPDVPFNTFELTLPRGPFSALGANLPKKAKGNFCGQKLVMPTAFIAQNGAEIHQNTPIAVTGCPKAKTRAQHLAAALKACKKKGAKRATCERAARAKYALKASRTSKRK